MTSPRAVVLRLILALALPLLVALQSPLPTARAETPDVHATPVSPSPRSTDVESFPQPEANASATGFFDTIWVDLRLLTEAPHPGQPKPASPPGEPRPTFPSPETSSIPSHEGSKMGPTLTPSTTTQPRPPPPAPISTGDAIKAILGLVLLLTLAYLGGHPLVVRLEQRLRISQVMTAGFPFVIFGLIAHMDGVDILSDRILAQVSPILPLGLGWIGFTIGFRFDLRRLENLPEGMGTALVLTTLLPFAAIAVAASLLFGLTRGLSDTNFLRDALLLATAGAMTARTVPGLLSSRGAEPAIVDRVSRIIQLEEVVAFIGLILLAAFFRTDELHAGWHLPSVGWVFVTLGIGTTLGGLVFALLRTISGTTETIVVMLGSIAFAAGMASYLKLSPIVVCFLAGALVTNLAGPWKSQVGTALARLERPIYLIFLVIAGTIWRVDAWESWALMFLFVASRLLVRFLGVRLFAGSYPDALSPVEQRNLAASPMGALSVAIVVNAHQLYSGDTLPWIVNAIIGGAILTEVAVQLFAYSKDASTPLPPLRLRTPTMTLRNVPTPPEAPPPESQTPNEAPR